MKKIFTLLLAIVLAAQAVHAQISPANYTFAKPAGTYTAISGGTALPLSAVSSSFTTGIPIGFTFYYMGQARTTCDASVNGFLTFPSTVLSSSYTSNNLGSGGWGDMVAPLWDALGVTTAATDLSYVTTGTAPNRIFTLQWTNVKWGSAAAAAGINFQVQLEETTNKLTFVYLTAGGALSSASASAGIKVGSSAAGGSGNASLYAALSNLSSTATVSTSSEANITAKPVDNQTFTFTPNLTTAVAPTSLAGAPGSSSVNLTWTAGTASAYQVYVSNAMGVLPLTPTATVTGATTSYIASGLLPTTNYTFRVVSLVEGGPSVAAADIMVTTNAAGTITSTMTGNWSTPATWGGVLPGMLDNVVVAAGHTVTVDAASAALQGIDVNGYSNNCTNLTVNNTGTLLIASDLYVLGNTIIDMGGAMNTGAASTNFRTQGSLTNNGSIDMQISTFNTGLIFYGPGDVSFTTSATSTTDLKGGSATIGLTVNKDQLTATPVLVTFNPGVAFTVNALTTNSFLSIVKGTFKVDGSTTLSNPFFATVAYLCPTTSSANGGFWLNNANCTVTGQGGSPTLNALGRLRISAGIYTIGTSNNSMGFSSGATIIIEGGAVVAVARFGVTAVGNNINYTQTGGIVYVNSLSGNASSTLAAFDMGTATTTLFTMSAGSVVVCNATSSGNGEIRGPSSSATPANINITGGTFQLGTNAVVSPVIAATPASKTIRMYAATINPNILVTGTNNVSMITGGSGAIIVRGDLTSTGTGSVSNNAGNSITMTGLDATKPGNISIAGTLTVNGSSGGILTFNSSVGNQSLTAGTLTGASGNIPSVTVNNTFGGAGTVTLPSGSIMMSAGALILTKGTLNGTAPSKFTIGIGAASSSLVQFGDGAIGTDVVYNLGSGGHSVTYNGTTAQTINSEIDPFEASAGYTLNITNALGVTLGKSLDLAKMGTLALNSGNLILSTFNILMKPAGTLGATPNASKHVVTNSTGTFGYSQMVVNTAKVFPIGATTTTYDPVTVTPTVSVTNFTAKVASSIDPLHPLSPAALLVSGSREWDLTSSVPAATTIVLTPGDGRTAPAGAVKLGHWNGTSWDDVAATYSAGAFTAVGVSSFSPFIAAEASAPLAVEFTNISATAKGAINVINFTTATEKDLKEFAIERSINNRTWEVIGTKAAIGGTTPANYSFNDVNPTTLSYYRVRSVETNGKDQLSKVVAVKRNGGKLAVNMVSPVPTTEGVTVDFSTSKIGILNVVIMDIVGKVVKTETFKTVEGANMMRLNLSNLTQGSYILSLNDGETIATQRIVKQ